MNRELRTGTFDLISHFFKKYGTWATGWYTGIEYENTHSYIADDMVETFAGDYAARLAEKETHRILKDVNTCK